MVGAIIRHTGFTRQGKVEGRGYLKPQASLLACQLQQECFNFWANKPASLLLLLRVNGVIRAGGGEASRFAQCALMGERVALNSYASEWNCYLTRKYADKLPIYPLNWWIRAKPTWFKAIRKVRDSWEGRLMHGAG